MKLVKVKYEDVSGHHLEAIVSDRWKATRLIETMMENEENAALEITFFEDELEDED